MMYLDKQFAAFLVGLFLGLMVTRQLYVRVVSNETGEQGREHDGKSETRPSSHIRIEPKAV